MLEEPRNKSIYRHGQHKGCNTHGTYGQVLDLQLDDHHSPCTPHEYLQLRVRPQLHFYQGRMPRYARQRAVMEVILVLTTLTGTALAFASFSSWSSISVGVATAVTA